MSGVPTDIMLHGLRCTVLFFQLVWFQTNVQLAEAGVLGEIIPMSAAMQIRLHGQCKFWPGDSIH